ncbi:MAG: aldo/keto reductase [Acidimicrobiales bacterium]|jgi:aryl-alcohol dehydrogenase (NADP+)|nr:aldo/keto reductase [Acidimicrobiales bacterium]HJM28427.1 aldo/keto reductase [Acidimicrobiales bacterium]HJM97647.1 aldo/keto reductase [Acidimicrobiales bacterium]
MEYKRLGKTGLKVSRLCLGTMTFGNQCDETISHKVLNYALESGISFIDTADIYPANGKPELVGETEKIIGRWIQQKRENVVLATKFWAPTGKNPWQGGSSRRNIKDSVEASLRRLQTDYIDLYQVHFPDYETPIEETLGALNDLVRQGKILYAGCSNYPAWLLALTLGKSENASTIRFDTVQPRYNLLFRQPERELFELCDFADIGVIPYNPLAGGFLTGKHKREAPVKGSRFTLEGGQGERYLERYWSEQKHDVVDALKPLANEAGITLAHLAVGWVLSNPVITSPIVGATKPSQLDDAIKAVNNPLGDDLVSAINDLTLEFRRGDDSR